MSIDTRVYLNKNITPEMVLEVVRLKIDDRATLEKESRLKNRTLYNLYITSKDRIRSIFMMYSKEKISNTCYDGSEEYLLMSMNSDKDSIELMKDIVNTFGGYIDENDCDDKEAQFIKYNGTYEKYVKLAEETKRKMIIKDIEDVCKKHSLKTIIRDDYITINLSDLDK